MALVPNRNKPLNGFVGTWANMEEANSFTMNAQSAFAAGIPVMRGTTEGSCAPLVTANRFIGIALATATMNADDLTADGYPKFNVGDVMGVADMGTVFVLAGDDVTAGAVPFYDPATRKFHGQSATGLLPLPNCEFDESAADGEPVALRLRIVPGSAVVTAVS